MQELRSQKTEVKESDVQSTNDDVVDSTDRSIPGRSGGETVRDSTDGRAASSAAEQTLRHEASKASQALEAAKAAHRQEIESLNSKVLEVERQQLGEHEELQTLRRELDAQKERFEAMQVAEAALKSQSALDVQACEHELAVAQAEITSKEIALAAANQDARRSKEELVTLQEQLSDATETAAAAKQKEAESAARLVEARRHESLLEEESAAARRGAAAGALTARRMEATRLKEEHQQHLEALQQTAAQEMEEAVERARKQAQEQLKIAQSTEEQLRQVRSARIG